MEFMKQEKAERQKEREADMDFFKEYIMKGVQEQVLAALKPMQEKQSKLEEEQVIINNQICNLLQEVKDMKENARNNEEFPPLYSSRSRSSLATKYSSLQNTIQENLDKSVDKETREKRKLAAEARKILGVHKISIEDVERASRTTDAKDQDEAYMEGLKEFFKQEMRMDQEVFDSLGIKKVFPPAKDNWDTLYVMFESERAVNIIYSYAKNLKKNQRLVRYIPKEFYERYRAMEADAYILRHGDKKFKTKVQMGFNDLILYKKEAGGIWSTVAASQDWPAVTLTLGNNLDTNNAESSGPETQ